MSEIKLRHGMTIIPNLPASKEPWKLKMIAGGVIAVSPSEGVFLIRDGLAYKLVWMVGDV